MLFSRSANLAYFHIHKTGGRSLRAFFRRAFPDAVEIGDWLHHDLDQSFTLLAQGGIDPRKVRILTTIRDPFAHVVSIYHFWRSQSKNVPSDHVRAARSLPFREFVDYYCSPDHQVYEDYLFVGGVIPPNLCVIRLERATEELEFYLNRVLKLGIRVDLPVLNTSRHGAVDSHYDAVTRQLVARHYAWVFQEGWYPLAPAHQTLAAARQAATIARQEAHALRISMSYRLGQVLSWPWRLVLSQLASVRRASDYNLHLPKQSAPGSSLLPPGG